MTSGHPVRSQTTLRLTTVAVMLALVLGGHGDLVCRAVCALNAAATSNCHHQAADAKVVAAGGECHSTILVPSDLPSAPRRGVASDDAAEALLPAGVSAPGPLDSRALDTTASPWRQLDRRPRSTILRI